MRRKVTAALAATVASYFTTKLNGARDVQSKSSERLSQMIQSYKTELEIPQGKTESEVGG